MSDLTDKHEYVVSLTERQACALRYSAHERVIRCRDCAFFGESDDMSFSPWCWRDPDHAGHGWPTDEGGFCAWAEPKEES